LFRCLEITKKKKMDFLSTYCLGQVDENIFLMFWTCSTSVQIFHSLSPVIDIPMKIDKKLFMSERYQKISFNTFCPNFKLFYGCFVIILNIENIHYKFFVYSNLVHTSVQTHQLNKLSTKSEKSVNNSTNLVSRKNTQSLSLKIFFVLFFWRILSCVIISHVFTKSWIVGVMI